MKRLMVRYKVKPECAAENEGYIARVFEQLEREKPNGVRYASFKLDDDVSFVHIVSYEVADGRNLLTGLSAFKTFAAGVKERCEEPPIVVELNEIGSYGLFGK
jgi:hypothetical protein